jgi:hypothetical protein
MVKLTISQVQWNNKVQNGFCVKIVFLYVIYGNFKSYENKNNICPYYKPDSL